MTYRSTSKTLIIVGALTLAALGALFYSLTDSPVDAPESGTERAEEGTIQATSPVELAQVPAEELQREASSPEPVREDLEVTAEEAPSESVLSPEDTVWIAGSVVLSPMTPGDEELLVLSLTKPRRSQRIYSDDGAAAAAWDSSRSSAVLLDQATVDEEGNFRVRASGAAGRMHLALSGRYSYCKASRAFELVDGKAPGVGEVVLAAELGAWLTGRVKPAPGAAPESVAGTSVDLGPDITGSFDALEIGRQAFSIEVECDESGLFEFRSLPVSMHLGIALKHDDFAAQLSSGIEPLPGAHLLREFTHSQGARLAGKVVDEKGQPVAEAEILARLAGPIGEGIGVLREATTDDAGVFRMEAVHLGAIELSTSPEGYVGAKLLVDQDLIDGGAVEGLVLTLSRGQSLAGRVAFPDGTPAAGVFLRVSADFSQVDLNGQNAARAMLENGVDETDAEGAFAVSGLGVGPFKVSAQLEVEEGPHAGVWRTAQNGVKPGVEDLVIELEKVISLSGRAVDLEGAPLESFRVVASLQGTGGMLGIGAERQSGKFDADDEGNFSLPNLRSGVWDVRATSVGYGTPDGIEVVLPEPESAPDLVFIFAPAARIEGVVLDTFGQSLAGAQVGLELSLADRVAASQNPDSPEAISDFEGKFKLAGVEPGSRSVTASMPGFASSEPKPIVLVSGEVVDGLVLELRVGGLLTGEVRNDEGEPAPGRSVIVQLMPGYNRQFMSTSDARGEFRFEHLEPGNWQVIAMPNVLTGEANGESGKGLGDLLGKMKMATAEIIDGESLHLILGQPPENPITLKGSVVHAGEAVPDAVVSFVPEGSEGLGDLKMAYTDERGEFQVDLDKRGEYLVTVQNNVATGRQNSIEFGETIPQEGEEHKLELDLPLGRISGTIEGPGGSPAANCRVTLNVEGGVAYGSFLGGQYAEVATDQDGRYDIPYLRPGTYTIAAGGILLGGLLGGDGASSGRVVKNGLTIGEGEWLQSIDFALPRPGVLIGNVQDSAGLPVAGAAVWVRNADGHVLERFAMVETDGAGEFTYAGLAPGTYSIFAKKGDSVSMSSAPARLAEAGTAEATVHLEPGFMLLVTVVDKAEAELRARISVIDGAGHEMSGLLSMTEIMAQLGAGFSAGVQRVGPLPAGKYRVTATLADGRETHKNVRLGSRPERKIKLRIK